MEFTFRVLTAIPALLCIGRGLQRLFPPQPKLWKRLVLNVLMYLTFMLPCWVGDENPVLLFPFFMLGFLVLVQGEWLFRLTAGGIFYALFVSINMLFDSVYQKNILSLLVTLVAKMLLWCLLAWLIWRIAPEGGLRLSPKLWLLIGGLTLAPLIATLSFSIWGNHFLVEEQFQFYQAILQRFGFTILPFVLISALTLLAAAVVLSRHEALEQQSKLAALREVYYDGLKQEQIGLRTLRHDLRNHVTALQGLLEQGRQAELARYLAELTDSPALDGGRRYCENETANIVLSSKAVRMEAAGLMPDFLVSLPEALSIPAPELCVLLGNALDNALEGAAGAENRTVTLRARLDKGVFMLHVQNAVGNVVNPDLSTTKADAAQHGFGLAGMREVARRHGGTLEATSMDGCFKLLVCFPCQA